MTLKEQAKLAHLIASMMALVQAGLYVRVLVVTPNNGNKTLWGQDTWYELITDLMYNSMTIPEMICHWVKFKTEQKMRFKKSASVHIEESQRITDNFMRGKEWDLLVIVDDKAFVPSEYRLTLRKGLNPLVLGGQR